MTPEADGELSRQLGRLEGKVEAVDGRLGGLEEGQREARAQSTQEHAEVRRDFAAGIERIEAALTTRLNKHAEEIDDLQESRAKGRGILIMLLSASTIAGAVVAILNATGVL
jgi:hypothetical protein